MKMNDSLMKTLDQLKAMYRLASKSSIRSNFEDYYALYKRYEAGEQWSSGGDISKAIQEMQDIGAMRLTVNRVARIIKECVSIQVRSGMRIGYSAFSSDPYEKRMAEYLKNLVNKIQTKVNHEEVFTDKVRNMIFGLGGTLIKYNKETKDFIYESISPEEIFCDPRDKTKNFIKSKFVIRVHFIHLDDLIRMYPKSKKYLLNTFDDNNREDYNGIDISHYKEENGSWMINGMVKIVEVYYKKNAEYYETEAEFIRGKVPNVTSSNELTSSDQVNQESYLPRSVYQLQTFDHDYAKAKARDKKKIEVKEGTQIWHGIFTQDILLDNYPILEQVPNQLFFPLKINCLGRDLDNNLHSFLADVIPIQDEYNLERSRRSHYQSSRTILTSDPNLDKKQVIDNYKQQINSKTGVIYASPNSLQIIDRNIDLKHTNESILEIDRLFEAVTGLYHEFSGQSDRALSGVAINSLYMNTMHAQNPFLQTLQTVLKEEGQLLLDIICGINELSYNLIIFESGESKQEQLNNQVALLRSIIYPDIVPDFSSTPAENRAKFTEILQEPTATTLLLDPSLLSARGCSEEQAYQLHDGYVNSIKKGRQLDLEYEQQRIQLQQQFQQQQQQYTR